MRKREIERKSEREKGERFIVRKKGEKAEGKVKM